MFNLTTKQSRQTLVIALLVYVAIVAAIVAWLAFNSEQTVQHRLAQAPTVTAELPGKEPAVPPSWQTPAAMPPPAVTPPPVATPPVATPPVTPPAPTPAAKPVETTPPVADKAKPIEVAKEAPKPAPVVAIPPTPVVTPPVQSAVTTNPDAAPPPQKWQKYARPFNQKDTRPRIGLIIADLGMASMATDAAIQELPGEVSLAFSSAAPNLEDWVAKGRAAGHELILTIPMEPENYPQNDPGPNTLLLSLPDKENVERINRAMARTDGYVAITPYMGEKFVTAEDKMVPVLDAVRQQQLMVLDGTLNKDSLIAPLSRLGKIPFVRSDMVIDASASSAGIDDQLNALEKMARLKGQAIGVALPYPVTFEKLKAWIATLDKKGIVLAPLTAMASEEAPVVAPPANQSAPETPLQAPSTAPTAPQAPANQTLPIPPKPQ
jgi:polysaccharide deacetylase 2 family uncharacterized protein YibQ